MHGNDRDDASQAAAFMSHTAEPIRSAIQHSMNNMFRLFQLTVRKQGPAHESLFNHKDIRDAAVLAIQEPQAPKIRGKLLTVPMGHHGWLKMVLATEREEQVSVESLDVTSAVIRLPERLIFMASVYVPGGDVQALQDTCRKLGKAITGVKQWPGRAVDVLITSEFNRHDQMKGVDDVSVARQDVMDPIISLKNEFMLRSLLQRGAKTWESGDCGKHGLGSVFRAACGHTYASCGIETGQKSPVY
ncbi:hypothetical protein FOQG_17825 [Fusarium oxysporum f. sp. raphani 54005]|uniref:Uncharacterized protein n=1 Tax=Fusarium oxysporum f. sp. raphani 54005 TaxID=1089458 RepID=X0C3W9_FUSOX|nr:hypothetical protein FOQG_17825 [Fusarium oxysporum f. sp. raphani 54005]